MTLFGQCDESYLEHLVIHQDQTEAAREVC